MTTYQLHKAHQILGFVNRNLKAMPNKKPDECPTEEEAQYLIQAAMFSETDSQVIDYCNSKFKTWYNCKG